MTLKAKAPSDLVLEERHYEMIHTAFQEDLEMAHRVLGTQSAAMFLRSMVQAHSTVMEVKEENRIRGPVPMLCWSGRVQ